MSVEYYAAFDWAGLKVIGLPLREPAVSELQATGKTWFILHFREEFAEEGFDTLESKTLVQVDEYRGNVGPVRTQAVSVNIPIKKKPVRRVSEEPESF